MFVSHRKNNYFIEWMDPNIPSCGVKNNDASLLIPETCFLGFIELRPMSLSSTGTSHLVASSVPAQCLVKQFFITCGAPQLAFNLP